MTEESPGGETESEARAGKAENSGCLLMGVSIPLALVLFGVIGGIGSGWEQVAKQAGRATEATVISPSEASAGNDLVLICGVAKTDEPLVTHPRVARSNRWGRSGLAKNAGGEETSDAD